MTILRGVYGEIKSISTAQAHQAALNARTEIQMGVKPI